MRSAERTMCAFVPRRGGRGGGTPAGAEGLGDRGLGPGDGTLRGGRAGFPSGRRLAAYGGGKGEGLRAPVGESVLGPEMGEAGGFGFLPPIYLPIMLSIFWIVFPLTFTAVPLSACTFESPFRVRSDVRNKSAFGGGGGGGPPGVGTGAGVE